MIRTMADRNGNPMIVRWMEDGEIHVVIRTGDRLSEYPWTTWRTSAGDPWIHTAVS